MSTQANTTIEHGAVKLPHVSIDSYNLEIRDKEGWIGDSASRTAFWEIVEEWRKLLKRGDADPFPGKDTDDISKKQFDKLLEHSDPARACVAHAVIEDFAQRLANVIRRFLKSDKWKKVELIVIGGGLQASRAGQIAIERTMLILWQDGIKIRLERIRHDPDDAGLVGAAYLLPQWMLHGFDAMLAVDIGGTNIRAGVLKAKFDADDMQPQVWKRTIWRHADDDVTSRDATVEELAGMLKQLAKRAQKAGLKLAPAVGIGCPGIINADGSIKRGAQNLPGKWDSPSFNLTEALVKELGDIDGREPVIAIHNDAVLQGLSELPLYKDIRHWAVLTIGTGLGNAKFLKT